MRNKCQLLLLLVLHSLEVNSSKKCYPESQEFENPADGVCSSIVIRNNVTQLRKLENCTVVEGHVHITLVDVDETLDYDTLRYPQLVEITDYLMLYRFYGITTLRHLFPNLAIIRGRHLFNNYALIAYEMRDLEELGLVSLRSITRGGVRLSKNNKLCYADTVDWAGIGVPLDAQDLKDNKEADQCANYCPDHCPTTVVRRVPAKRCWTSQHCQQGLDCQCNVNQTCMDDGSCCHEYCLGGCTDKGSANCIGCKGVIYLDQCLPKCPVGTFMFFDRRCLTLTECLNIRNDTEPKRPKILNKGDAEPGLCVFTCPPNYTVNNSECIVCDENCTRGNVAMELEKSLGNIKTVTGSLIIRRSYALLSLYFFKSLETIGTNLENKNGHSLIVMDNSNLQELFPEKQMKKMKILQGRVSFHSNRKLCYDKITTFANYLNISVNEDDVSPTTNGDLRPCMENFLNLTVINISSHTAVIEWQKEGGDVRQLLLYIINYREVEDEEEDVNIFQGRDACSDAKWLTKEQQPSDTSDLYEANVLIKLKPFTKYVVYVQAYTLKTAAHSAMTHVEYFTTKPFYPTEPIVLQVTSDSSHELHVKWKPPKSPHGIVTHFIVTYQKEEMNIDSFEQRNYCLDPVSVQKVKIKEKEEEKEEKDVNPNANCCACPKTKEQLEADSQKQEIEVFFENHLQTEVYCKRFDKLPDDMWDRINFGDFDNWGEKISFNSSRMQKGEPFVNGDTLSEDDMNRKNNQSRSNRTLFVHEVIVENGTETILPNLEHFQEYSIEVQACQEAQENGKKLCSNKAITWGRTKASWEMDKINVSTIKVDPVSNSTADVIIKWESPATPNGLILVYNLFYKRANQENLVPQQICINRQQYHKLFGYKLTGLEPGNWSFQLNAVSLAGNSTFTPERFFMINPPPGESSHNVLIAVTVIAVLFLIIIVVVIVWAVAKNKFRNQDMTVISPNINYVPSGHMYIMDGWEVDRDKIKLIKELGQGSFGMVYEGLAKGLGDDPDEEIRVAVKTVNDRANFNDRREFLKEATTMKAFDCFHVVKLLGVVSTGQPALVIMELMALGDLKNYLREHRPDEQERPGVSPPRLLDILQMAGEIADGMAYLADKKFVHRDLAARNCMVAEDKTVKIGDFGMTRDIYETDYYRKGGKGMLPVRWMAPESLKDGVFTSMSDVWSYGVVMWEMVTLAAQPYQGLSNEEVVKYISEGNTMDMPDRCPEEMAYLMQRCWAKKPKNRPTFKEIIEYLLPHLNARFEKVSYFFNDGGGPMGDGDGDGVVRLGHEEDESDEAGSMNSLSCEGAAAPRLSLSGKESRDYQFQNSPHPSGGTASLYDDGMDREGYMDDETGDFEDVDGYNSQNEFGFDDSSQPFMPEDLQAVPFVKTRQPSLLSHEPLGNNTALNNSGHIELQPLISKDRGLTPSPRANTVQNINPFSSEYISHQSPPSSDDFKTTGSSQPLQQHNPMNQPAVASGELLRTGPSNHGSHIASNPSWQLPPSSASMAARPSLRLPVLNDAPSGGFRRVPLFSSGDRSNYNSRNSQHSSSDKPTSSPNVVTMEEGLYQPEETSPDSSARHYSPPLSAITSSSDDSKESSKSSGSHSLMNGLTNGHIPSSTVRHRTTPC